MQKKALYGLCGHHFKDEEDDEEDEKEKTSVQPRTKDALEPTRVKRITRRCSWRTWSSNVFNLTSVDVNAVINLTSVDVNTVMAGIGMKLSYVGILWTAVHEEMFLAEQEMFLAEMVQQFLHKEMFSAEMFLAEQEMFLVQSSPLYEVEKKKADEDDIIATLAVVYKTDYDAHIRNALRKNQSEDDFVDQTLKDTTEEILATLEEEINGKPKGDEVEKKKADEDGPVSFATAASVMDDIATELGPEIDDPTKLRKWLDYAEYAIFLAFGLGAWRSCVRLSRQFRWICACLAVVSFQSR
jgi:hypothetical protein